VARPKKARLRGPFPAGPSRFSQYLEPALLKEIAPGVTRVAVLRDAAIPCTFALAVLLCVIAVLVWPVLARGSAWWKNWDASSSAAMMAASKSVVAAGTLQGADFFGVIEPSRTTGPPAQTSIAISGGAAGAMDSPRRARRIATARYGSAPTRRGERRAGTGPRRDGLGARHDN
jgi:hypothetical protein